jgi:hypothetical protein
MIKAANDDGIKLKTAREAKEVLVNFLAALGHKVEVSFEEKALNAALGTESRLAGITDVMPGAIAATFPGIEVSALAGTTRQFCGNDA